VLNRQTISSLLQVTGKVSLQNMSLQTGKMFRGKAIKLFPDHYALLQLDTATVLAKLKAPLTMNRSYLFQVQDTQGSEQQAAKEIPVLKVVEGSGFSERDLTGQKTSHSMSRLLENLGIPFSKTRETIVRHFLNEGIPFSKETIVKGGEWLKGINDQQAGIDVLKEMSTKGLPMSKAVFEALFSHRQAPPIYEQIVHLRHVLSNVNDDQLQALKNAVSNAIARPDPSSNALKTLFQEIMTRLGLQFENDLRAAFSSQSKHGLSARDSLKPLLIDALNRPIAQELKEPVERLLSRLTGQQLHTVTENGPMTTTLFQLPLQLGEHYTDLTIRREGKKKQNGTVDSDFCRVLFYLELEHLRETVVNMQIQKRTISLKIYNENEELSTLVEAFKPLLKQRLEALDYGLSMVKHVQHERVENLVRGESPKVSGVDMRI
jgi:hypothetical protein